MDSLQVLNTIKLLGDLVDVADKRAEAQIKEAEAIDALIPKVVDVLIANQRLQESLREKAAEALKDPKKALEILANVAAHRLESESDSLGSGTNEKEASINDNYLGRKGGSERESDRRFRERIMNGRK